MGPVFWGEMVLTVGSQFQFVGSLESCKPVVVELGLARNAWVLDSFVWMLGCVWVGLLFPFLIFR